MSISMFVKFLIGLGSAIIVWGVFRYLIHLANNYSKERKIDGSKNLSYKDRQKYLERLSKGDY